MDTITIQKQEYENLLKYRDEFLKIKNEVFDFADENEIDVDFSDSILAINETNFLSKNETKNALNALKNRANKNV